VNPLDKHTKLKIDKSTQMKRLDPTLPIISKSGTLLGKYGNLLSFKIETKDSSQGRALGCP